MKTAQIHRRDSRLGLKGDVDTSLCHSEYFQSYCHAEVINLTCRCYRTYAAGEVLTQEGLSQPHTNRRWSKSCKLWTLPESLTIGVRYTLKLYSWQELNLKLSQLPPELNVTMICNKVSDIFNHVILENWFLKKNLAINYLTASGNWKFLEQIF